MLPTHPTVELLVFAHGASSGLVDLIGTMNLNPRTMLLNELRNKEPRAQYDDFQGYNENLLWLSGRSECLAALDCIRYEN